MKMVALTSTDVDDQTKKDFMEFLKKNHEEVVSYVCPWCLTKQFAVNSSREKIRSDAELKVQDQEKHVFDRACVGCGKFMIHTYELDMSGFNALINGSGIN